jgi:hypothetical protein
MEDDRDKKFLALTAGGIATLIIIFTVTAQAELGRTALSARDIHMPPTGWTAATTHSSCLSVSHCAAPGLDGSTK